MTTPHDINDQDTDLVLNPKSASFPCLVHRMLSAIEKTKHEDIKCKLHTVVSWQDHGMAFMIHDRKKFIDTIMPLWFPRLKYVSWVRQLNLFGFKRVHADGKDKGAMYQESFIRGMPELAATVQKVKHTGNTRGSDSLDSSALWEQKNCPSALASCTFETRMPTPSPIAVVSSHNICDMVRGRALPRICSFSDSSSLPIRRLSVPTPQLPFIYWPVSPNHQEQIQSEKSFPSTDFPSAEANFLVQRDVFSLPNGDRDVLSFFSSDMSMYPFPVPEDDDAWDLEPLPL
jgi:HSF-type DNA-binding